MVPAGQASTELRKHNEELLDELEDGDLIEFPRGVYSHWAVYVGDGYVVHLAGDENDGINAQMNPAVIGSLSGKRNNKATVRKDDFWDVVGDSRAEKNNSKDRRYKPRPKKEIVRNALESVGKVGYNLLEENCEHFATWCRSW
nr:hypothetical protein BaRGS_015892 [Batillaria attramentaria]